MVGAVTLFASISPVVIIFSLPKFIEPLESEIEPPDKVKVPTSIIGDVNLVVIETVSVKPTVNVSGDDTTAVV